MSNVSGVIVGEVMKAPVVTVDIQSTVAQVAALMTERSVGSVVILKEGKAAGILTERDIVRLVSLNKDFNAIMAGDVMSSPLLTLGSATGLEEAVKFMVQNKVKKLPIVQDERLLGIITFSDFARLEPFVVETLETIIRDSGLPRSFEKYYKPKPLYVV